MARRKTKTTPKKKPVNEQKATPAALEEKPAVDKKVMLAAPKEDLAVDEAVTPEAPEAEAPSAIRYKAGAEIIWKGGQILPGEYLDALPQEEIENLQRQGAGTVLPANQ
jgi:hypothetical protein